MGKEGKKKENYVDRDVSWMYFNHRILQEGRKEYVPLLERLSFLGIYSNNLDEFFRVRVASLNRLLARDGITKSMRNQIKKSLKTINLLNETYSQEYTEAVHRVLGELALHKIRIVNEMQLNEEQKKYLTTFFYEKLNGSVNPIWLSEIKDLSSLEDNRIYLLVEKSGKSEGDKPKYAIIKVPDRVYGRWQKIPSSEGFDNIMYLDDVVRYCLPLIFIGFKESQFRAFSFKFTKDAEMDLDTENEFEYSTVEKVAAGVDSRRRGEDRISATEWDTMLAGGRYQNHKDLMSFPACGHEELRYPKWPQIMPPEFLKVHESVLDLIRQRDLFIHVPYHSFNSYIRVLQEAAIRPEVKVIKTTLYRLAKDSKVVKALITAARNGKEVTAVVELLARFDEESNIKWSKRMQEEGVNVIFGVEGLKIHSKLLYLESKKGNIACVGTGNFHEGNAKIYTDYMMMTARPRIVNEVAKVFNFIDRPFSQVRFQELMVSPNSMKSRILRLLDTEIKNAQAGKEAWVKIKINHITEPEVVNKLYHASCAGVKIDILIRGNCSLVPGIPGLSENIRCVGIIDRYLEHSRVLIFCNGGNPRYYLGSADWMPRNLLNRIEVMTPVYDEALRADLLRTVEYGLKDTTNARVVDGKGTNEIQKGEYFRSQEELYKAYLAENENGN